MKRARFASQSPRPQGGPDAPAGLFRPPVDAPGAAAKGPPTCQTLAARRLRPRAVQSPLSPPLLTLPLVGHRGAAHDGQVAPEQYPVKATQSPADSVCVLFNELVHARDHNSPKCCGATRHGSTAALAGNGAEPHVGCGRRSALGETSAVCESIPATAGGLTCRGGPSAAHRRARGVALRGASDMPNLRGAQTSPSCGADSVVWSEWGQGRCYVRTPPG